MKSQNKIKLEYQLQELLSKKKQIMRQIADTRISLKNENKSKMTQKQLDSVKLMHKNKNKKFVASVNKK